MYICEKNYIRYLLTCPVRFESKSFRQIFFNILLERESMSGGGGVQRQREKQGA